MNKIETNDVNEIVLRGISTIVENREENWTGTMTNLSRALNRVLSKHQRELLPASPSALRVVVNRVVNRLRNRGIGVKFIRANDQIRSRIVKFSI